jgi:hypothetical protein
MDVEMCWWWNAGRGGVDDDQLVALALVVAGQAWLAAAAPLGALTLYLAILY